MTNPQGTEWETQIVKTVRAMGRNADRFPKRGQADEPDLFIGSSGFHGMPIVFWKRLVGTKADGRRKPDGERAVVIIGAEDFLYLLTRLDEPMDFLVQAKWTAALNPTRTLYGLRQWGKARMKTS